MLFWKAKRQTFAELNREWKLPIEEVRRRARILVIDNDSNAFPVELLRGEGYNIQQWIELSSLRNLEEGQFDIIVLDIHGICPESVSQSDGLGVLEHLKKTNPAQIVIAFSGKKFDLKSERFWRIADDYWGKPIDMLVAKAKIDALLSQKFTAQAYWDSLVGFLKLRGVADKEIAILEDTIVKARLKKNVLKESDVVTVLKAGKDIISTAWIIVQVIQRLVP